MLNKGYLHHISFFLFALDFDSNAFAAHFHVVLYSHISDRTSEGAAMLRGIQN